MLAGKLSVTSGTPPTKNIIGFNASNDLLINEEVTTNSILINGKLFGPLATRTGEIDLGDSSHMFKNLTMSGNLFMGGIINPNANSKGLTLPITTSYTASKTLATTDLLAAKYSASSAYAVGELVTYGDFLYKCTTAIAAGGEA
jgi:hypothetical protein